MSIYIALRYRQNNVCDMDTRNHISLTATATVVYSVAEYTGGGREERALGKKNTASRWPARRK